MGSDKTQGKSTFRYKPFALFIIIVLEIVILLYTSGVIPGQCIGGNENESVGVASSVETDKTDRVISKTLFGETATGKKVYKYKFTNKNNVQLEILNLGGIITNIRAPCRHGHLRDVIVGFETFADFLGANNKPYFGALIGRVANRISNSSFTLDGVVYSLYPNDGVNSLHGGHRGWDRAVWGVVEHADHIELSHTSPDGDEGYPGEVEVKVIYRLTDSNEVFITFTAKSSKKTPINLTSHPYFNLGGERDNATILDHEVSIFADQRVVNDRHLIPTGKLASVSDTLYDLRTPVLLADVIYNVSGGAVSGFDNTFVLRGPTGRRLAAKVYHAGSGRILEVYTNQPGLQFYTGNFVDITCGKNCNRYGQHSGLCMETQNYPDAINKREVPGFPDSVLQPGSTYVHQVWYKFSTEHN